MMSPDFLRPHVKEEKERRYEGDVVWVFGASRGIGMEAAVEYALLGAEVYMGMSDIQSFKKTEIQIGRMAEYQGFDATTLRLHPAPADVRDINQLRRTAETIKRNGHRVNKVIFSQAAGMNIFGQELIDNHLEQIADYTADTPIDELPAPDRRIVDEKLEAMRQDIHRWNQQAAPYAEAVNFEGTKNAIEVLEDSELCTDGYMGVFYNSTWGDLSGTPGIQIPLVYRTIDLSKGKVRDFLTANEAVFARNNRHIFQLVASLVKGTQVAKLFDNYYFNLMDKDQREAVQASAVETDDVARATNHIFASSPDQWPVPHKGYLFAKNGVPVFERSLEISEMYTRPYRF